MLGSCLWADTGILGTGGSDHPLLYSCHWLLCGFFSGYGTNPLKIVLGALGETHPHQHQKRFPLGRKQESRSLGFLGSHHSPLYDQTISHAPFTMTMMQEEQVYWEDALEPSSPRTGMRVEPTLTSWQPCNMPMTTTWLSLWYVSLPTRGFGCAREGGGGYPEALLERLLESSPSS